MRSILFGFLTVFTLCCGSSVSASLLPDEFTQMDVAGFRLGMSMAEAEAVIRARTDLEEPSSQLMHAYDCNDLLSEDSDLAYEALAPAKLPVSYYIDTRDHHLLDIGLEYGPMGARVARIMYWKFLPNSDWTAHLSYAEAKFGAPDIVRSEDNGMTAIWCETGDAKCASDEDYRRRIVLRWWHDKDRGGQTHPYGTLSVDQGLWLEAERTEAFAEIARRDPVVGKELFEQCRQAVGTFTERAEFERHLGNMVGALVSWSPAVSEPRLVDAKLFRAIGVNAKAVMAGHDCAMRRQAGLRDLDCNDQSAFRWMRNKDDFWLLAIRDVSVTSHRTQSGTLSYERLIYCLVRHEPFGPYDLVWAGESLVDLSRWLASGEQRNQRSGKQCQLTS